MKPPDRQFTKLSDLVRSLPDNAQLPVTPPPVDITQLTTVHTYPDAIQLPMVPVSPDVTQLNTVHTYPDITQLSTAPVSHDIVSSIRQDVSPNYAQLPANQVNQSRLFFYSKIVLLFSSSLVIPFLLYVLFDDYGVKITPILCYIVAIAMIVNAYSVGVQTLVGLRIENLPVRLATLYPPASAIIAAYLPNEAGIIVETVKSVLRVDYPGPFQVILAYNTPYTLPVESALKKIAARDRRLVLLRIENSISKAENINCAIREVTGTFVGIFDADYHPALDSFKRAWQWLAHDYHVVQGRCMVRNGDRSQIARLVAVEFEVLYALEYPGHTRMHDFGIFAGANGYWRTDLLRKLDMNSFMVAENIDASMRALQQGYKIMYDPLLISSELAPETLSALWNQRMRQAQGWFQVSLEHFWMNLFSPRLSFRQKLGSFHLLLWRGIYAWLSVQIFPILAFQVLRGEWSQFAPLFILSIAFTIGIHLLQVVLAYRVAVPEIRRHGGWFVYSTVFSLLFFKGIKNHIARIAQLKELSGECDWSVTPRSAFQVSAENDGL